MKKIFDWKPVRFFPFLLRSNKWYKYGKEGDAYILLPIFKLQLFK